MGDIVPNTELNLASERGPHDPSEEVPTPTEQGWHPRINLYGLFYSHRNS
jgi:hypothetical protein